MNIRYDKVRNLVLNTIYEFQVPKAAADNIAFCVVSQWNMYGHFKWFTISSSRARLLKDPTPTTLCLQKCLLEIETYPDGYFSVDLGPSIDEVTYKPTAIEAMVYEKMIEKKEMDEYKARSSDTVEQVPVSSVPVADPGCDRE